MPVSSETVSLAGSGLVFNNSYGVGVTDAYRGAVVAAENYLQAHFVDAVTVTAVFDFAPLDPDTAAQNIFYSAGLSYSALRNALTTHATTADDLAAAQGLPLLDPSQGVGFAIPTAMARMLGFSVSPTEFDINVTLNSHDNWTYGEDAIGALVHELTEGVMGRNGSLGIDHTRWAPLDLFRFTAAGVRDYTGGADGQITYFGIDAQHVTSLDYHNALDLHGVSDHGDLGDWEDTFGDSFGPGGALSPAQVTPTDLQVLDILGWTPTGSAPSTAVDDFASSLADTSHPMGAVAVGGAATGVLDRAGDRDWFQVQLTAGHNYVISQVGHDGGGGTLVDPTLFIHGPSGALLAFGDDIVLAEILDSRVVFHADTSGTYYIEAGSFLDAYTGSYTISIQTGGTAGSAGGDYLVGEPGGSTIAAGSGADTITGADATNYLRGDEGDDLINGGALFDDINGNMGNDTVHGGEGDDWTVGGKDDDLLFGEDGNDIVYGNLGNDTCDGGWDNDLIRGGQGNDVLTGGEGADWMSGDRGDDTLTGGAGADIFHTFNGAGLDVVLEFSVADGDRVQLDPGTTYTVSQVGIDTVIDLGNGDKMILKHTQLALMPVGWIFGA